MDRYGNTASGGRRGYPVDPIFLVPPRPDDAIVKLNTAEVNNPADYFSSKYGKNYSSIVPKPLGYMSGGVWIAPPGTAIYLLNAKKSLFNCIEIDISCVKTPRGYCVPGKIGLTFDTVSADKLPTDYTGVPNGTIPYLIGIRHTQTDVQPSVRLRDLLTTDREMSPNSTAASSVAGDDTNSTTPFSGNVWKLKGLKPFTTVRITTWKSNDIQGNVPEFGNGFNPTFALRCWYDPNAKTLT